jgi:cell division protein FtsL
MVHRFSAVAVPRRGGIPFVLLFLVVTGILVTTLVAAQALVAQGSFRIHELQRRVDALHSAYGQLRLRYAELASPGRIEAAAKDAGLIAQQRLEVLPVPGAASGAGDGTRSPGT